MGFAAAPPPGNGHHHTRHQQTRAKQCPAPQGFTQENPGQKGGEQGMGGKQNPAAPWAQSVHAGKQSRVANEDADQPRQSQPRHTGPVQAAPLTGVQGQGPQQNQGKKQTPAGERKSPQLAGRGGREQAAKSPAQSGQGRQIFGWQGAQLPATIMRLMSTEPTVLAPML